MEHNDREYTDMLNNELKDIEPGAGLHTKVRDGIARNVVHVRRRNTALGAVAIAIVLTMALSTVTPVFGRNGTLPQVIAAISAERQAKKISKTLGKSPVEQTEAALQTSEATMQTVSDSAVSDSEGVLAVIISKKSGASVTEVLALRATGLGWGRIMAQLNVSGRDIGKAMSQVKAAAATKGQGENSKLAVSNTDGNKIVVNGEITDVSTTTITGVSTTTITVAGKTFVIGSTTQLKYRGKAITAADIATKKLTAGKLYATVQGTTSQADTSILANLIIVQDGASSEQTTPSNEQTNPSNEQTNPSNERAAVSNEQQVRGKVGTRTSTTGTPTTLYIDGFVPGIILNADTKVEQVGAGSVDLSAIEEGQTVQVHVSLTVSLTGTTYTATQVHIEDKYVKPDTTANEDQTTNSAVTTWQGTIASIAPDAKSITLTTDTNPSATVVFHVVATSILQDASHKALLFGTLTVGQNVTIMGKALADHSVEIVKLIVTTDAKVNPGKGNGKN